METTCSLGAVLPKCYQHVNIPTTHQNTLDHESCIQQCFEYLQSCPHFRLLDYISLFLYPAYRQRLKQITPVSKQVKLCSLDTESIMQDYAHTDLNVFQAAVTKENSPVNIEEYVKCLTSYISTSTGTHHTGQEVSK